MKIIDLTKNRITVVDDEDYDYLVNLGSWHCSGKEPILYAKIDVNDFSILMHRIVLRRKLKVDELPEGYVVDHINRDTLDNRRENLRLSTKALNAMNTGLFAHNKSGYKGVGFHNKRGQWRARIGKIHLGWFNSVEDAVDARERAEEILYHHFKS